MKCLKRKFYFAMRKIKNIGRKGKIVITELDEVSDRYVDLAPIDSTNEDPEYSKSIQEYIKGLNWALNNPKILNIAITGPYGSGKSSLINSYIDIHPELKFIKISLANFDESEFVNGGNNKGSEDASLLQVAGNLTNEAPTTKQLKYESTTDNLDDELINGILRQLFYKVDKNEIPQSRYRKLQVINKELLFLKILLFMIVCFLLSFYAFENAKMTFLGFLKNAQNNFGIDGLNIFILALLLLVM